MHIILLGGLWLHPQAWTDVSAVLSELGQRPLAVTLPGQGDGAEGATLEDQQAVLLEAIDAVEGPTLVVGHSAACALAWWAADARPERVATVVLIGGMPVKHGETYAEYFPIENGQMAFPGWEPFAGPDSDDLSAEDKRRIEDQAIPVPEGVAKGTVTYSDDRRYAVPVVMVCPEFTPDQARQWLAGGDIPELDSAQHVEFVDIDSGHWPMFSQPRALARILAQATAVT